MIIIIKMIIILNSQLLILKLWICENLCNTWLPGEVEAVPHYLFHISTSKYPVKGRLWWHTAPYIMSARLLCTCSWSPEHKQMTELFLPQSDLMDVVNFYCISRYLFIPLQWPYIYTSSYAYICLSTLKIKSLYQVSCWSVHNSVCLWSTKHMKLEINKLFFMYIYIFFHTQYTVKNSKCFIVGSWTCFSYLPLLHHWIYGRVELILGDKMPSGIFDIRLFVTSQNYV